jgi:hypothetical protein
LYITFTSASDETEARDVYPVAVPGAPVSSPEITNTISPGCIEIPVKSMVVLLSLDAEPTYVIVLLEYDGVKVIEVLSTGVVLVVELTPVLVLV